MNATKAQRKPAAHRLCCPGGRTGPGPKRKSAHSLAACPHAYTTPRQRRTLRPASIRTAVFALGRTCLSPRPPLPSFRRSPLQPSAPHPPSTAALPRPALARPFAIAALAQTGPGSAASTGLYQAVRPEQLPASWPHSPPRFPPPALTSHATTNTTPTTVTTSATLKAGHQRMKSKRKKSTTYPYRMRS